MQYLHTMLRVADLDAALSFYCGGLGLVETRRIENEKGRFTLVFLAAPDDMERAKAEKAPLVELTYNWPAEDGTAEVLTGGRNFGHLAYQVAVDTYPQQNHGPQWRARASGRTTRSKTGKLKPRDRLRRLRLSGVINPLA